MIFFCGKIADPECAAIIVPSCIGLICLILMPIVAFISYKGFKEVTYPAAVNIAQNSTITTQIGMFPNNNSSNQLISNNIDYLVIVSETGNN